MVRGHNRGLRPSARRADPLLRFGFRVDRIEDLLRVAGLAVTETVIASSRASLREKLAMRNVARRPWDPLLPAPVISPSITANSTVLLFRNASRTNARRSTTRRISTRTRRNGFNLARWLGSKPSSTCSLIGCKRNSNDGIKFQYQSRFSVHRTLHQGLSFGEGTQ
jgi:hypothetical protein